MEVLIFTDVHIHAHKRSSERLQDCLNCLEWVFKTALDRNIKQILFLGDLFHDRQKISVETYQKVFVLFEKYLAGPDGPPFEIHLLLGNHDLFHFEKRDISSVFPLRSLPGVHVISEPCTKDIGGHDISFLPYTTNPIEDLKQIENTSSFKILCGHIAVDGALWNVHAGTRADVSIEHDGKMTKVSADKFEK